MRGLIAIAFLCAFIGSAEAHSRHHVYVAHDMVHGLGYGFWHMKQSADRNRAHHHAYHHRARHHYRHSDMPQRHYAGNLITIQTAAGIPITVAADFAYKIRGFIGDLIADTGYRPRDIHCFAATGHIPGSLHHIGKACDFDQTGWNRTARVMYSGRVTELAARWGLQSGCEFHSRRDCGHIQDRVQYAHRRTNRRYAGLWRNER